MAASTKRFTLTSAAYQDISEGSAAIAFRLTYRARQETMRVRIALATSLPSASTTDYDLFEAPPTGSVSDEKNVYFSELDSTNRVYARAASEEATVSLPVYRM